MVRETQEWWRALIRINKFSACLSAVYKVSIKKMGLGAGLLVLLMIFYSPGIFLRMVSGPDPHSFISPGSRSGSMQLVKNIFI
jgi:hypothetical protein